MCPIRAGRALGLTESHSSYPGGGGGSKALPPSINHHHLSQPRALAYTIVCSFTTKKKNPLPLPLVFEANANGTLLRMTAGHMG